MESSSRAQISEPRRPEALRAQSARVLSFCRTRRKKISYAARHNRLLEKNVDWDCGPNKVFRFVMLTNPALQVQVLVQQSIEVMESWRRLGSDGFS